MGITYTSLDTTKLSTAEVYAKMLADLAEQDDRIVTLTADLAKSTKIGAFAERFLRDSLTLGLPNKTCMALLLGWPSVA